MRFVNFDLVTPQKTGKKISLAMTSLKMSSSVTLKVVLLNGRLMTCPYTVEI